MSPHLTNCQRYRSLHSSNWRVAYPHAKASALRRERLDVALKALLVLPFAPDVVAAYAKIVSVVGFSRRRVLDRLIAATALVHDFTLVPSNGLDFHHIPGLKLEIWPRPAR